MCNLSKFNLMMLQFFVVYLLVGCTTATVKTSGALESFDRTNRYEFISCEFVDSVGIKSCDARAMNNLSNCKINSNVGQKSEIELKMIRELEPTGNNLGWTPISIISFGIIPSYSTAAIEKVSVIDVKSNVEVARWQNHLEVQAGWFFYFKQIFTFEDPNDYCSQFQQEIR